MRLPFISLHYLRHTYSSLSFFKKFVPVINYKWQHTGSWKAVNWSTTPQPQLITIVFFKDDKVHELAWGSLPVLGRRWETWQVVVYLLFVLS